MELSRNDENGIPRTSVAQTLKRPVWGPPDIDIITIFEKKPWVDFLEAIKIQIPDPTLRCDYLDLYAEYFALLEYWKWAQDVRSAACDCGRKEKEEFYNILRKNEKPDLSYVLEELDEKRRDIWPDQSPARTQVPESQDEPPAPEQHGDTGSPIPHIASTSFSSSMSTETSKWLAAAEELHTLSSFSDTQVSPSNDDNDEAAQDKRTILLPQRPKNRTECCSIL